MEIYQNTLGENYVIWTDENGMHSMLKSAYDELKANEAAKTI
jgi:hypothetical protein